MGSEGKGAANAVDPTSPAAKRRRTAECGGTNAPSSSSDEQMHTKLHLQSEGELALKKAAEGCDAAAKAYASLQAEVARLEKDLAKALQVAQEQKALSDKEVADMRQRETLLRQRIEHKEQELAAEKELTAGLTAELEMERGKLKEAAAAGERKMEEDNRFHHVLARTGQAGSIPRSFLESDADSLLSKMFNGEWDYARDEQGRALLNCNPEHWTAILDYLTSGTLPVERNQGLLDQARYWNIEQLVRPLEALTPGVTVKRQPKGSIIRCTFTGVMDQLDKKKTLKLSICDPELKQMWIVVVEPPGVYLCAPGFDIAEGVDLDFNANCTLRVILRDGELVSNLGKVEYIVDGQGFEFGYYGFSFDELASEPLAIAHDCIVVEVEFELPDVELPRLLPT